MAPSKAEIVPDAPGQAPVQAPLRRRWLLAAATILIGGLVISLACGMLWRASVQKHDREAFKTSSTDVTETLETMLNRDNDFVAGLRAVMTMQPRLSASEFHRWFVQLEGRQRQVGSLGTTVQVLVPASELAAFQARRNADPAFRALMSGKLVPVPNTARARYCLISAGGAVTPFSGSTPRLLQSDWCDPRSLMGGYAVAQTTQAAITRAAAESGAYMVYLVNAQGVSTLFVESAFYRQGAPLRSPAQRRAAVAGWISSSFDMSSLLRSAIGAHRDLGLTVYHANPGGPMEMVGQVGAGANQANAGQAGTGAGPAEVGSAAGHAEVGSAAGHASGAQSATDFTHTTALQIDGRWMATVQGSATARGLSADVQGLLVFLSGALISALLFALVLVLSRQRERALGLVQSKTGELRHQALHDALTGLPNRVLAIDRAEQMLARARRQQIPVAALYVDIDGFKHVNDTFGHAAGDELLRIVAARLSGVVREGDTAARLGGDEFVVLVEGTSLDAGPELVAERLLEVLRQPCDMNGRVGRALSITASVGVAMGLRESADELLRDADVALYAAKAAGKNRYMLFQSTMHTAAHDRMALEMDLGDALAHEELFLLYQPTFDLQSEKAIGVEALIRWRHPTRGIIMPTTFIPIAEESGQIVPIGRWVLQTACEQAAKWHSAGHEIGMAVNVSARQLDHDELVDEVREVLKDSGLQPAALTLEITETTLMRDADATARRIKALKELGVRIAIDDFGTGYSSLAYLRQFPVDALKIDRSFIHGIAASKESSALIHTLVQLGKSLHLETLAEGIEEQTQLKALQREQCDHGQGFLFARPLSVAAVEEFLDSTAQDLRSSSSANVGQA
jgi:diguanylate cyclase (GGDEF)-like protein